MKKLSFLILSLFLLSDVYAARFNGIWSGPGEALGSSRDRQCNEVFFQLEESDEEFKILYGGYTCEDMQAEYPFSTFQKFAGFLIYKEQMVGTYTENTLELNVPTEFYRLKLELNEQGQMSSVESWDDGSSFLIIQSQMQKR